MEPTEQTTEPAASAELLAAEARRRRGFKRLVAAFAGFVVLLVAVRLWWGWEANRRLQAEIDRIRAAGEPILVEDFQSAATIPDEENAAVLYRRAYAALVRPTNLAITLDDVTSDARVASAYPEETRAIIEANSEVLALLRRARKLEQIDWGIRLTSPMIALALGHLAPQRGLGKLASATAVFQHRDGDHGEAIRTLADLDALSMRLSTPQSSFLIAHLVTTATQSLLCYTIEEIAPNSVTTESQHGGEVSSDPAWREQIEALIERLLREGQLRSSWRSSIQFERALQVDCAQLRARGQLNPGWLFGGMGGPGIGSTFVNNWLLAPMIELDGVRMARWTTDAAEAGFKPDLPIEDRRVLVDARVLGSNELQRFSHMTTRLLAPSYERALELHIRALTLRRMAATRLAIRLYELDHGHRPETLEQLLPGYLEAVPLDPFASDGRTIAYKPMATPPILFSVGHDGVDDHGQYALKSSGEVGEDWKDLPFFLDGDRPSAPMRVQPQNASSQAVIDDAEEPEREGNSDDREKDGDEVEGP